MENKSESLIEDFKQITKNEKIKHDIFTLSIKLFKDKCFELGIKYALELLALEPHDSENLNNIGAAYFELKNYDYAQLYINQALNINRGLVSAWFVKANIFYELGNLEQAESIYNWIINYHPDKYPNVLFNQGLISLKKHQYPQAIEYFQKVQKLDENFTNIDYYSQLVDTKINNSASSNKYWQNKVSQEQQDEILKQ